MAYAYDHNTSLVQRAHRLRASPTAPLALAEARVTGVQAELRLTLTEEQVSNLEAQASYLAARVCQLEAELAEVRTQNDNLEVERDEWKRLAQRLLTPKRFWWWRFS
jgi:capsule polysaccharide export protein KpsE/RkpR